MKKVFKTIKIIFICLLSLIAVTVFLNVSDAELDLDTKTNLEKSLASTEKERESCAAWLGLLSDPKLDGLQEGRRLLGLIEASESRHGDLGYEITVSHQFPAPVFESMSRCKDYCNYSSEDKAIFKNEFEKRRVFMDRFQRWVEIGVGLCNSPVAISKVPVLGLWELGKMHLIEINLLANNGNFQDAADRLQELDQFLANSLLSGKNTVVGASIGVRLLTMTRKMLIGMVSAHPEIGQRKEGRSLEPFRALKYDDLVKQIEIGELQAVKAISRPMLFEKRGFSDSSKERPVGKSFGFYDKVYTRIVYYFYHPQETLNDNFRVIRSAAWSPCIGQTDIRCVSPSFPLWSWLRNPVGKVLTLTLTNLLPEQFQRLKKLVDRLPQTLE